MGRRDNTDWADPPVFITYARDNTIARSGSSLKVTISSGFAQVTQVLPGLPTDAIYTLSLWVRAQPPAASAAPAAATSQELAIVQQLRDSQPLRRQQQQDWWSRSQLQPEQQAPSDAQVNASDLATEATAQSPSAVTASSAGVTVTFGLRRLGDPYEFFASTTATIGSEWVRLAVPMARPDRSTSQLDCAFLLYTDGPGVLWLDDASLQVWPPGGSGYHATDAC
jgi:hypothetical protein